MRGREVKNETAAMTAVPVAQEGAHRGVLVGIEVVEHQVNASLPVVLSHQLQEGEKILAFARRCHPTQNLPPAYVEAGKQAARSVAAVVEFEAAGASRRWRLELSTSG